ncbi:MAG TPA: nuclear transport factor 2 family protein [Bacillales bacterium]|nr:nuclear transport factor 2 family protein [Bacillales bacterium]
MSELTPQEVLKKYEEATNSHVFENVSELIAEDAVYYFSDKTVKGKESLKQYFEETFDTIRDEVYTIRDVNWIALSETVAVCIYRFHWEGNIEGHPREGNGRGTNVFHRFDQGWKVVHEHLSTLDS